MVIDRIDFQDDLKCTNKVHVLIPNLTQAWRKYLCTQNVVRAYEAICIGKTVVSDKSTFNYYLDAVIEVEDPFADLIYTIKNSNPTYHSSAFRDLTYEDSSFEIYKSELEHRFNQDGNARRSRVPNPKFDYYNPL